MNCPKETIKSATQELPSQHVDGADLPLVDQRIPQTARVCKRKRECLGDIQGPIRPGRVGAKKLYLVNKVNNVRRVERMRAQRKKSHRVSMLSATRKGIRGVPKSVIPCAGLMENGIYFRILYKKVDVVMMDALATNHFQVYPTEHSITTTTTAVS